MDLETRLALLEQKVSGKNGLEDRMEEAENGVTDWKLWKRWVIGVGATIAALLGYFASEVKQFLSR